MKKIKFKKHSKVWLSAIALAIVFTLAMWASYAYGEQHAGTPESGEIARIETLYTDLQTAGYGSDENTPDRGTYWNRISTAAKWVPSGTATAAHVVSGKTFYNSNRNQETGALSLSALGGCPTQQYSDSNTLATPENNCALTWTVPNDGIPGTDKQDPRSDLIWSFGLWKNNDGVAVFSATNLSGWSWDASGPNNIAVGDKTAIELCSSMGNGWRLPTHKEALQAHIDGARFNLVMAQDPYSTYWTASLGLYNSTAVEVYLFTGDSRSANINLQKNVRCVR